MIEAKILNGLDEIADFMKCRRAGIRKAIKSEGFPAYRTPAGPYRSHTTAIHMWCLTKMGYSKEDIEMMLR